MIGSGEILIIAAFGGFCLLFLLVVAGIIYIIVRSGKAVNASWGEVAQRTGLAFKPEKAFTSPELSGTIQGHSVRVYTYSSGSGQTRQTYTATAVTVNNPGGASMAVMPSGSLGSLIGRAFKAQDVEIGNQEFDQRFVIKSDPPEFARKALNSIAVQTGILGLPAFSSIDLNGQTLSHSRRGLEESADAILQAINTLMAVAHEIEA